jgi:hypothetical protein
MRHIPTCSAQSKYSARREVRCNPAALSRASVTCTYPANHGSVRWALWIARTRRLTAQSISTLILKHRMLFYFEDLLDDLPFEPEYGQQMSSSKARICDKATIGNHTKIRGYSCLSLIL